MRALVHIPLTALVALALVACSGESPTPNPGDPAGTVAPATATAPAPTALDTATLRERATAALAANRLYAPAGDNAVEDYLALRERQPGDSAIETALADLAPYVVIGAEQATAAGDFAEAGRLVDLLARMDEDAPAVPRLRDGLAAARSESEARLAAERSEADRLAREAADAAAAAPVAASPTPPPDLPSTPAASRPTGRSGTPAPTSPVPPPPAPPTSAPTTPAPPTPAPAARPAARDLVHRVQPRFPEAATRRRLQGEVELQVHIRADGSVEDVEVLRATPPGVFDREAVLAVRRWRYAPATDPGQARVVLQFKRPDAN